MMKIFSYDFARKEFSVSSDYSVLESLMRSESVVNWIDFDMPSDEDFQVLEAKFQFHPLAVEDCKNFSMFPKMDEFETYLFMAFHDIQIKMRNIPDNLSEEQSSIFVKEKFSDFDNFDVEISEINFFVTKNSIVSVHPNKIPTVARLMDKITRRPDVMQRGRDFLLHELIDMLIDQYMEVSYVLDEVVEILEEEVISARIFNPNEKIIGLKKNFLLMRRTISHEKNIISRLIQGTSSIDFSKKALIYLRDVYDHILILHDSIEINREMLSVIFEAHLSIMSNQMNKSMMKLTTIATIFMPLTFIAGVYGMNFKIFPELEWHYGYLYAWVLFFTIGFSAYYYFKKRELI